MLRSSLVYLGALSAISSSAAYADEISYRLPDMVVTATRMPMAKSHLDSAITVFTRDDIARLNINTLPELLRAAPGLHVVENGGYGKNASVFLRGTNSDHVLVLIDGIRAGSVTLGTTAFQFVPIDQIERVEIIRGPQSSKYGSEAIGGVIQIFTRQGSREGKTPHLELETGAGSYDTYRVAGTVSGKQQSVNYTLSSSFIDSQGFNARQALPGPWGFDQPDRDGYRNAALNARLGYTLSPATQFEGFFLRAQGRTEFDGTFQDKTEFVQQNVGFHLSSQFLDSWRSMLQFGQNRDDGDNFMPDGSWINRFNNTRWNVSWLNELQIAENHQLTLGADYRLDEIDSNERYIETTRYDVGVFAEWHGAIANDHRVNASLRWDNNEAFGDAVTGGLGWRYAWFEGLSLLANFGSAFKAPSFNWLYFPGFGNPALGPEYSLSVEAGVLGEYGWGNWELRAYHTKIDDLIAAVMDPVTFMFNAQNIGRAQIQGIEAILTTEWQDWRLQWSGSLMNPKALDSGARLPRRPERSLSFDLSRSFGRFDTGVLVLAQSDRYDDPRNQVRVQGFVTLDWRAAYHFNDQWEIRAKLANLLDEDYQTAATFPSAGRNFFFSVHYRL